MDSAVFPLPAFSTEAEGEYGRPVRMVLSTLPAFTGLAFGETQIISQYNDTNLFVLMLMLS